MSTFKGIIQEFPHLRIDHFRRHPNHPPPLACLLSHIHSDHLLGLESLKAPFIYCSRATKEILLRLEKYPSRMNFATGILETRKQTYGHLRTLLKCIPLEAPTVLELAPGNEIRVTLFDANHCVGAVMFLIEGGGKAVPYTGDLRSETWFVNGLVRNPVLVPYASGIKTLDCIYLDTTFASKEDVYAVFPSKADGVQELLRKVGEFSRDTVFYFMSWTFGYEDVWVALSAFLEEKVHLEPYRWSLYRALRAKEGEVDAKEAAGLCGYMLGNHWKEGCLTRDHTVRIHSCERGGGCPYMDGDEKAVYIMPVVSRLSDGTEIREVGVGGGKGDMSTGQEIEVQDVLVLDALIAFCASTLSDPEAAEKVIGLIRTSYQSRSGRIVLQNHLNADEIKLETLVEELVRMANQEDSAESQPAQESSKDQTITFPYSRHSSYSELCEFVGSFRPKDVYPCTVDENKWTYSVSMRYLFGEYCSGTIFRHDEEMYARQRPDLQASFVTTETQSTEVIEHGDHETQPEAAGHSQEGPDESFMSMAIPLVLPHQTEHSSMTSNPKESEKRWIEREVSPPPKRNKSIGQWAYEAALGTSNECKDWREFGGLTSTKNPSDLSSSAAI